MVTFEKLLQFMTLEAAEDPFDYYTIKPGVALYIEDHVGWPGITEIVNVITNEERSILVFQEIGRDICFECRVDEVETTPLILRVDNVYL